ncbi:MAG: SpoVR family protein [Deltaproteobacteria bacterium]|nr:SpoVR family protein [Deltaproteobacteria bacterium]
MAAPYTVDDLMAWDERIREQAAAFGLDCFPQEFELCDHNQMLGYMAYSGMPSHYPHWSYGKAYEKLKTLYDYGVSGLPYEMVINSSPALAYLMRDNTLLLQILTIAHVYGHNDFFKNNATFRSTRPEFTISSFKAHAARVRRYIEDPSIGLERVEPIVDAAHALSLQCRRNLAIRKRTIEEVRNDLIEAGRPPADPFQQLHRRPKHVEPDLRKVPPEPDEDVLLFIRDHNPYLAEWERDLITIVHEEAQYFIPQIETKIMNEGWASYWHKQILDHLDLPEGLQLEFIVRHNQVVRPFPGGLNPYHLGFKVWEDIRRRYDDPTAEERAEIGDPGKNGLQKMFEVRESDRDVSFLRRHLTEPLLRELDLFEYEARGDDLVVSKVADSESWRDVKALLLQSVGMATVPVIKVDDADFSGNRTLYLVHAHDGRDLLLEHAEKTLAYLHRLWQREVALETLVGGKRTLLAYTDRGFSTKSLK